MTPVREYHAHVYFDGQTRARAIRLRKELDCHAGIHVGRMHDHPVGPHRKRMFQVRFSPEVFASFVPWLMLSRCGLDVLVHPDTGNDYRDHTHHAMWLGSPVPLDTTRLSQNR